MSDAVTKRYAEALFSLASSEGVLEAVSNDVLRLRAEFDSENVRAYLLDARIPSETRLSKLETVTSSMNQLTQNFVRLLFDRRREGVLAQLGEAFHQKHLAEAGAAEGVVESVRPLDEASLKNLADSLTKRIGKTVTLTSKLNPDLLGGARVIVENRMIDFTLRGRLDALKKRMLEAPIGSAAE